MMEPTGEMTPGQVGAIQHSIRIGSLLVNDHPEIAELYRDGMSYPGIAEILDDSVTNSATKGMNFFSTSL